MASLFRRAGAQIAKFLVSSGDPGGVAGQLKQYIKLIDGVTQLFTQDSASTIYQMTPPGIVGGNTISPAVLGAGTTNDYAPAGLRNATVIRQDLSGLRTITGLDATTAGGAGRRVTIINIGTTIANQLVIANENAGSSAANRFTMPGGADFALPPGGAVTFEYDGTSLRWRPIGIATNLIPEVIITPASIGVDQNNYNPTGLAGAALIRQQISASVVITGLVAQPANTVVTIQSLRAPATAEYISFAHESASSTAANRFSLPVGNTWYLPPTGSMTFRYDGALARWVLISFAGNAFPNSNATGGPGVSVGFPVENIGLRRESSQIIGMLAGSSVRETWSGSGSDPLPVTFPNVAYVQVSAQMRWSAIEAIGPLTGTVNNQAIATTTLTARFTTSGATVLTGLTNGAAGRVLTLVNPSANNITLNSEDAGSTAANRFLLTAATIVIPPEGALQVWYDTTSSRWRALSL